MSLLFIFFALAFCPPGWRCPQFQFVFAIFGFNRTQITMCWLSDMVVVDIVLSR